MSADKRHEQSTGRALLSKDAAEHTSPQSYGAELSKAGSLLESVNKALTTTVNGEFFEGSKSSNANRHRQLPEIFQLRDKIEGLLDSVDKKERLIAEQERVKNERLGKPAVSSATIQAMVQSAVQQQLAKELRDLQIKNERFEERLQKMEKQRPATIDGAKKVKKPPPPNQSDVKNLQRRLTALEAELAEAQTEVAGQRMELARLQIDLASVGRSSSLVVRSKAMGGEGEKFTALKRQVDEMRVRLDDVISRDGVDDEDGSGNGSKEKFCRQQ